MARARVSKQSQAAAIVLALAQRVPTAPDSKAFYFALRMCYEQVFRSSQTEDCSYRDTVEAALSLAASRPGVEQALTLSALPFYDKPNVPNDDNAPTEFVWLFTIPVLVGFPTGCEDQVLTLDDTLEKHDELARAVRRAVDIGDSSPLHIFPGLYRRDDFLKWGLDKLEQVGLTTAGPTPSAPPPLPLRVAPATHDCSTALLFALCCARVPVGTTTLTPAPAPDRMPAEVDNEIADGLGIRAANVRALGPVPMGEALMLTREPFQRHVEAICRRAKQEGIITAGVDFPLVGYVEMTGLNAAGEAFSLLPPTRHCEPASVVASALETPIKNGGLRVMTNVPLWDTPTLLH